MAIQLKQAKLIWLLTKISVAILSVIIFTPLVIPMGQITPKFLGLPYNLWTGILSYIIFFILIIIGITVHSQIYKEDKND